MPDEVGGQVRRDDIAELDAEWSYELMRPKAHPVQAGFFSWNIHNNDVDCDEALMRLHGVPDGAPLVMDTFLARVPSEDLEDFSRVMYDMANECGTYQIRYRIVNTAGRVRAMEARGHIFPGTRGEPAQMVGIAMDTTAIEARRDAVQRKLVRRTRQARRMQQLTAALAAASSVEDITAAAAAGLHAFGARALAVLESVDDCHQVVSNHGFTDEDAASLLVLSVVAGTPVSDAMDSRAPVFVHNAEEALARLPKAALAADPGMAERVTKSAFSSWAVLPLTVAPERPGACLLGFTACQAFLAEERTVLVAIGGLLAQSLERARRYEAEHKLVTALQRGMLPSRLPEVPGMTLAARYRPAASETRVGGDWYDAIPLPSGDLAIVIGDVMGHSADAAALMGRLRTAVHAYVSEGHPPSTVIRQTNRLLSELNDDIDQALYATCSYALISPYSGRVTLSRAGHPPPTVLRPGEGATVLDVDAGIPLGIDREAEYPTTTVELPVGSVLALTTDGALETPDRDIDSGIRSVLAEMERPSMKSGVPDLDDLADRLVSQAKPSACHEDDIAVILVRLDGH